MIILEEPGSGEIFLQNTPIVNINGSLGRSMGKHIREILEMGKHSQQWGNSLDGWLERQTPASQFEKKLVFIFQLHGTYPNGKPPAKAGRHGPEACQRSHEPATLSSNEVQV